ncbi:hypothetical protein COV20_05915 [Candidatus Woesearchaeota archaeon CG10_big_fil_rev_8_21_14_0_10_45_16]|nr:MAG: hypothetical protein COV20_05915 [Candidatus Woesearchaeota archaeon CG10_big_fil_rev_8_21_14_0_10_45_16]
MVYKIGLIGTHGTGKTALAALLSGELKRRRIEAKFIGEVATEAKERGLPINEGTTLATQLWILHTQFAKELAYSSQLEGRPNYEVIICDRGPDNYCYLEHNLGKDEYALQLTLGHLKAAPYSQLYLLPVTDTEIQTGSGVRALDKEFQKEMDQKIRKFLSAHGIPFIELPKPSLSDNFRDIWIKMIVNQTLKDLGHPEEFFMQQTLFDFE